MTEFITVKRRLRQRIDTTLLDTFETEWKDQCIRRLTAAIHAFNTFTLQPRNETPEDKQIHLDRNIKEAVASMEKSKESALLAYLDLHTDRATADRLMNRYKERLPPPVVDNY